MQSLPFIIGSSPRLPRTAQRAGNAASGPILALLLASILGLALLTPAQAQTAGQITPKNFLPPPPPGPPGGFTLAESPQLETPAGADKLTIRIGRVVIEGGFSQLQSANDALVERLSGRKIRASEIFAAARALGEDYARAGYVLARVVLPAQALRDGGPLKLVVIDGRIERVDVEKLPENIRDRVARYLTPLKDRPGLTLSQIERQVLLAGDLPGTTLRSTLTPGATRGGTVLVLEARQQLVTGSIGFDDTLARQLGTFTLSQGLEANSPLGFGEQFYVRAGGWPGGGQEGLFSNYPRNRFIAGGFLLPLGDDGLTVNVEATNARTTPLTQNGGLKIASEFQRYSLRLRYPLIRGRALTLNAEFDFDAQPDRMWSFAPINSGLGYDDPRILRLASDGFFAPEWGGLLNGRFLTSFGVNSFGARGIPADGDIPLTRQGSRPDFQKVELYLRYQYPLSDYFAAQLEGRGQTSFGVPLPRAEQIGIATLNGLSSFNAGQFQGDSGYVFRGELQAQDMVALQQIGAPATLGLAPYLFGAIGGTQLALPTALERWSGRGKSYGFGLRWSAAPESSLANFGMSLEYGRGKRSDYDHTEDRFTFSMLLRL